jgi:hypothetical protein
MKLVALRIKLALAIGDMMAAAELRDLVTRDPDLTVRSSQISSLRCGSL